MSPEELIEAELEHLYGVLDGFSHASERHEYEMVMGQIKDLESALKQLKEIK